MHKSERKGQFTSLVLFSPPAQRQGVHWTVGEEEVALLEGWENCRHTEHFHGKMDGLHVQA